MKTMSDFIMEQEVVSTPVEPEVTDVDIMESFMKMNAVASVVDCYIEHAAIAEFAEAEGLNVFAESADDVKEKKAGGIKKYIKNVLDWVKKIAKAVWNFITGNTIQKCIDKLDEIKKADPDGFDSKTIDVNAGYVLGDDGIINEINHFVTFVHSMTNSPDYAKNEADQYIEDSKKRLEAHKYEAGEAKCTLKELRNFFENAKGSTRSKVKKILDDIDLASKKWAQKDDAKYDKEAVKAVKTAANLLAKEYDKYTNELAKITNKLLKEQMPKKEKKGKEKVGESAEVDTEGYNFL